MTSQNQACQCDDSGDKYDVTYFLPIEIHSKEFLIIEELTHPTTL